MTPTATMTRSRALKSAGRAATQPRAASAATAEPRAGRSAAPARPRDGAELAQVVVTYCPLANYTPVARRLAGSLQREFAGEAVEVELVPASGGVYEVSVNGRLVFSKRATYRLPDDDEIFYHVRAALGRQPGAGAMIPPSG